MRALVAATLMVALFAGCASDIPDADGDGLDNAVEEQLGLDPQRADSDGDGVSDAEEDTDGDGVSNAAEIAKDTDPQDATSAPIALSPGGDAVVVAVIDGGFNPYHYDFQADQMPQALNNDASDDLPLKKDPATWLPGFPGADAFASYSALDLTAPDGEKAVPQKLHDGDDAWGDVKASTQDKVNYYWIPGTKVIGYVNFGGGDGFSPNSHGVGTSSVSVGNIHGACPECLLVFVHGTTEQANRWVEQQDWIDAQTNSWGISTLGVVRDRVYDGSDTESQRGAIERGQQIFFSAGNGVANDFITPNPTLLSSQEGPDWIVTVGAVTPTQQEAYSGAGKPADIANIGSAYPSAGGETVTADSTFGGTSNATPVTTGEYARALYLLRREHTGDSRVQKAGLIVPAPAGDCDASAACDGITVHELRTALFAAAKDPAEAMNVGGAASAPAPNPEAVFASYGHGVLTGRLFGDDVLAAETAAIAELARTGGATFPADEAAWFVADSYCRQGIWGAWTHGDFGANATLPDADPEWPLRSYYAAGCPDSLGTVRQAMGLV